MNRFYSSGALLFALIATPFIAASQAPAAPLPPTLPAPPPEAPADSAVWRHSYVGNLNFNQSSFSANWKAGGVNSVAFAGMLTGKSEFFSAKYVAGFETDLQYGIVSNAGQSARKNIDRIFLDAKAGRRLNPHLNAIVAANLLTQFDAGYSYGTSATGAETKQLLSRFFSPGYLTQTIGLEYKPSKAFSARLGVIGLRQTFVLDTTIYRAVPANYGVPVGQTVVNQINSQLLVDVDQNIAENVNFKARLLLFSNWRSFDSTFGRLDAVLTGKVNSFLNVMLSGTLLYDKTQDLALQSSQVLAIGIGYKVDRTFRR
jgi:hypothetical protein